ncbi:MAG: hypothetical protein DI498_11565 [Paracoccus denitrificans]|nr:MAG: hypothetical protein DI498_11565 [Paracoccus denitrificans]PZO83496.1 MAG: hypothetical protein DI633_11565 [Paracoccus denitrificans]
MQTTARLGLVATFVAALAACAPTTDADRALIGAGIGATAAHIDGKSVLGGAAAGAAGGALCDDVGICQGRGPYYRGADGRLR